MGIWMNESEKLAKLKLFKFQLWDYIVTIFVKDL